MKDELLKSTFSEQLIVNRSKISAKANMRWDHYHDFYEIYYYLGNEMNYFIDNTTYNVRKHDVVLIDRYMLHRTLYTSQNHGERILILFHPNILKAFDNSELSESVRKLFQKKKLSFKSERIEVIDGIMNRLYSYFPEVPSLIGEAKVKLSLLELLLILLELSHEETEEEPPHEISPKEKRVSEVVTYINSNYQSDITLDILCRELYINKYYLCHIFKEITGLSVIDFINTKRLAEAERLLRYSRLSITEICETVGFNSISHFINLFKKSYKCTPRAFRNSLDKKVKTKE